MFILEIFRNEGKHYEYFSFDTIEEAISAIDSHYCKSVRSFILRCKS